MQYGTSLRIFDTYVWFITTFYLRRLLHEIPVGKNLVHAKGTLTTIQRRYLLVLRTTVLILRSKRSTRLKIYIYICKKTIVVLSRLR